MVVNKGYNNMVIKSISIVQSLYADHMKKTSYITYKDAKGHEIVRQVVEQAVTYSKFPVAGNGKGLYVDILV